MANEEWGRSTIQFSQSGEVEIGHVISTDYDPKKSMVISCLLISAVLLFISFWILRGVSVLSGPHDAIDSIAVGIIIGTFFSILIAIPYGIWLYYRGLPTSFLLVEDGFLMTFRSGLSKTAKWRDIVAFAIPSWEKTRESKKSVGKLWLGHKLGLWVIPLSPKAAYEINAAYVVSMGECPPAYDKKKNKRLVAHEVRFDTLLMSLFLFMFGVSIAFVFIFFH